MQCQDPDIAWSRSSSTTTNTSSTVITTEKRSSILPAGKKIEDHEARAERRFLQQACSRPLQIFWPEMRQPGKGAQGKVLHSPAMCHHVSLLARVW
ncbi:hypothetical protein OIU85_006715 [Salix viminalis]|uniref:Uncharacterized protein n=1 Tax=Salix viminalis TaxID=40686 RepID=A0A9Q0PLN1_SALVM|nr:hypothetical protein OIU85_006715 [Salix viminalis]